MDTGRNRTKKRSSNENPVSLLSGVITDSYKDGRPDAVYRFASANITPGYIAESVSYEVHKGPPFKEGGPFALLRYSLTRDLHSINVSGRHDYGLYVQRQTTKGKTFADFSNLGLANYLAPNTLKSKVASVALPTIPLQSFGNRALARINPLDISGTNLVQSLVELLREGLPNLPLKALSTARKRASASGGEYLNVQFGWMPLINDIRNIVDTYKKADNLLAQIIRDNGKPVRRRVTLMKERTVTQYKAAPRPFYGGLGNGFSTGGGSFDPTECTRERVVQTKVWTVGRGRYYIPNVESVEFKKEFLESLYGTRPTLPTLYELMPWSWLIDYFTNLGEVVDYYLQPQLSEFVLDYAYLMRHNVITDTYFMGPMAREYFPAAAAPGGTNAVRIPALRAIEKRETKERIAATPFGFGLKLNDLSAKQLAILTALGISRQSFL